MAFKFNGSTLTRRYRDSTNEIGSMSINGVPVLADGTNYQAVYTALSAVLDAMEAFQSVNVQFIDESFIQRTVDPNGTDIPTDSAVQREAIVILNINDGQGNTFQRSIPCVNHANVTLASNSSDVISPASAEWQALNTALTDPSVSSPYQQIGCALQSASVGGRNN